MVKLIVGVVGTGKTKTLIDMVNASAEQSKGSVICIEQGNKLNFDITYKARLIDTKQFDVEDAQALYGFVAGIAASDHDITNIYIDSALKICANDVDAFAQFVAEIAKLAENYHFDCVMTVSSAPEALPASLKEYIG